MPAPFAPNRGGTASASTILVQIHRLSVALLLLADCATPQPVISPAQIRRFQETVTAAEAAGARSSSAEAAGKLRDAEADFNYAENLPQNPDRARIMAERAQREADEALAIAKTDAALK